MEVFTVFFDGLVIFLIVFESLEREIVEILSISRWMGCFLMVCDASFDGFGMCFGVFYRAFRWFLTFFSMVERRFGGF